MLFSILLIINSFIFINKNFLKTKITTEINLDVIEGGYEHLIYIKTFDKKLS